MVGIIGVLSLSVSMFVLWQTKKQERVAQEAERQLLDIPKGKVGAFFITSIGFFLVIVGLVLGILIHLNAYFMLCFAFGIVMLGKGVSTKETYERIRETKDKTTKDS